MITLIAIPNSVYRKLRKKAEKEGVTLEEYLLELIMQDIDPKDRAYDYLEASFELLAQAKKELEDGDLRQASEKLWGATVLAIKAYAYWKDRRRLTSHRELWEYSEVVASELGEWMLVVFEQADSMHRNFYEGWAKKKHIEVALKGIEKLIKTIAERIGYKVN